VNHLLSEDESRPSFLTQPVNEHGATHPLNLSSPLTISLPSLFHPWRPLFISSSLLCNIICNLFFCSFFSFFFFFLSSKDFICSLIFSQFSLSSSILCSSPLLSQGSARFLLELLVIALSPSPATTSSFSSLLSLCPSVRPSCFFFFCFFVTGSRVSLLFQMLSFADDTGKHFASLNYALRLHKNLMKQPIYF